MKFRNPETGEAFSTITGAWTAFMCPGPCGDCNLQIGSTCEREWIESHPSEAARLMGYEVVEEGEEPTWAERLEASIKHEEEANMDKPRICEILGVEPGESFYIRGLEGIEFWIMDDGTFSTRPSNVPGSTKALLLTLDHPERIIRKPRFTQQEVEAAKAIKTLFPCAVSVKRLDLSIRVQDRDEVLIVQLSNSLFRSIQLGETYTLDEIIGGAE